MQIEAIKRTPIAARYIENMDEDVAIMCVKSAWNSLEYIKVKTPAVVKEAVHAKGWAIQFVESPNEELKIEAVSRDYDSIKYIDNPSEEVQIQAIKTYYAAIKFIKNPTLKAKIEAVRENGEAINYMNNYDLDEVRLFIEANINVVKYIYESIDVELVVEVLTDIVKRNDVSRKYIKDFLELEILEMDKINFIREYGSKNAKKYLVDYKLSI